MASACSGMRSFLRWFLDFLDRKFPDQVVVTAKDYARLHVRMAEQEERNEVMNQRLAVLELNVTNINTAIGFSAPKMGVLER